MDQYEDDMLASSLHAFEAARDGHVHLEPPTVRRVLLVLDGSDQEPTVRALAAHVAGHTQAEVIEKTGLATAHDIAREASAGADLVVLAAPHGEDFAITRDLSLGSAVDIVLAESKVPVLVARAPVPSVAACFQDVLIPISICCAKTSVEASWALALAAPGGRVEVLDAPDLAVIDEVKHLLGDAIDASALRGEALKRAASRDSEPVAAAAREAGQARGIAVDLRVQVGELLGLFDEATRGKARLVVTSLPGKASTAEFHRAHDLALRSPGPVLFV